MRILVINPNTSESMTDAIAATARIACSPGTQIIALTPDYGAVGVDCAFESLLSAVAVMDRVSTFREPFDAVVMAGFGEHGREGVAELVDVPVLDIAECAAHAAMLLGRRFSVITTEQRSVAAIEDRLMLAGLQLHCASIRAIGMATLTLEEEPERAADTIVAVARQAVLDDHAEVICLGCGGMAGLDKRIAKEVGVPVIDGVAVAVRLAESLVSLGLSTSKVSTYATPAPQQVKGWPLSQHLLAQQPSAAPPMTS